MRALTSMALRAVLLCAAVALCPLPAAAARSAPGGSGSGQNQTNTPGSYVISVAAQAGGKQPYPRACQNRGITLTVGADSAAKEYQFTVDTGSGLLELACQSKTAQANCGKQLAKSYVLTPEKAVTSADACNTTGIDCFVPGASRDQPGTCYYAQGLTGGQGYNGLHGVFAQDQISIETQSGQPLTFPATFACAQSTWFCSEGDKKCLAKNEGCPTSIDAETFKGGCVGDGKGIEAGFTFALPSLDNGIPSAVALPEQVYQAGLINERVLGICWQPPQKDANCSADITDNSAVVLGSALPQAVPNATAMHVAPLTGAVFKGSDSSAAASTHTFRTVVAGASVPVYNSSTPWTVNYTSTPGEAITILWDTGAYGMSVVTPEVFQAFMSYYNASSAQVKASTSFNITACDAKVFCGSNSPSGNAAEYACQHIELPSDANDTIIASARQTLLNMYPPTVDVLLEGGAVAPLPGAFAVNDCVGSNNSGTAGVAVCSYMRAPPTNTGMYMWVAGPFFTGRFVQFDLSQLSPPDMPSAQAGVMRFSDPISACQF